MSQELASASGKLTVPLRTLLAALKRVTKREVCNTVALRRQVADAAIDQAAHPLG